MKIKDIQGEMSNINIEGKIIYVSRVKMVNGFNNKRIPMVNAEIEDDSGSITLTVFGKLAYILKKGKKIKIENGFTKEYRGKLYLRINKDSKIEVL